jgi:hypothetical protein
MWRKSHLRNPRRGITSMLAMLYLVLFSSLAIGFYASVNTAVQVANNEQQAAKAMLAAESGLHFIRYHLAEVSIPARTPPANMMSELYSDLQAHIVGTKNLTGNTIALVDNQILIPAAPNGYVPLDGAGKAGFKITILQNGPDVVCQVSGRFGAAVTSTRSLSLDFKRQGFPPKIFDYAVASKGKVSMIKGSVTGVTGVSTNDIASILSAKPTSPAIAVSGGLIGGDIHVIAPGLATVTGGSVGGSSSVSQILTDHTKIEDAPEFPEFDTTVFAPYATNTYTGGSLLKNVRIPPNTNPRFAADVTIQGILYIESPNTVEFRGGATLQGFIVFENKGSPTSNKIDMRGSVAQLPLPPDPQFDPLRSITGISVFAPTASLTVGGAVDSNLVGNVYGNIIVNSLSVTGSADWTIEKGSLITLNPGDAAVFSGKTVRFKSIGKSNPPTKGLLYSEHYLAQPDTYREIY